MPGIDADIAAAWADDAKTKPEKIVAKVALIHAATTLPKMPWTFDDGDVSVTVTRLDTPAWGWEIWCDATVGGVPVADRHHRIVNPAALVDDLAGDVVRVIFDPETATPEQIGHLKALGIAIDKRIERRLREDPLEALRLALLDSVRLAAVKK